MPETKAEALRRASRINFDRNLVVKATSGKNAGNYFIAPQGITKQKAKTAYANCRSNGGDKSVCASIALKIEKGE